MAEKVNLRPDGFTEGGVPIDDFDGTLSDIRFVMTDYEGNIPNAIPAARVVFVVDGEEVGSELLSVGGKDDFAPDETGMGLMTLKGKGSLTKGSKFSMFLSSFVDSGFPLNKMDFDNIAYLVGTQGHFLRRAVQFKGIKKKDDRESTVLVCTKIIKLPWEAGAKAKSKAKGKAVDAGVSETAVGIIQSIIIDHDGEVAKKTLLSAMFKNDELSGLDNKQEVMKLVSNDKFLKEREEWTYEDGVLKMV